MRYAIRDRVWVNLAAYVEPLKGIPDDKMEEAVAKEVLAEQRVIAYTNKASSETSRPSGK